MEECKSPELGDLNKGLNNGSLDTSGEAPFASAFSDREDPSQWNIEYFHEFDINSIDTAESTLTCCACCEETLVLGTSKGEIVIMSYETKLSHVIQVLSRHISVKDVSVSSNAKHLAYIGLNEKNVNVYDVVTKERGSFDLDTTLALVVIDPEYKYVSNERIIICTNTGKILELENGFSTLIYECKNLPLEIQSRNDTVIWIDQDVSIYLYNRVVKKVTSNINLYKCCGIPPLVGSLSLCWDKDELVMLSISSYILKFRIMGRPEDNSACKCTLKFVHKMQGDTKLSDQRYKFTDKIHALSQLGEMIVLLTTNGNSSRMMLRVTMNFCADPVPSLVPQIDYKKSPVISMKRIKFDILAIISTSRVVLVKLPSTLDISLYLSKKKRYMDAVEVLQKNQSEALDSKHRQVYMECFKALLEEGKFSYVSSRLPNLIENREDLWCYWIDLFIKHDQIKYLMVHIKNTQIYKYWKVQEILFRHLINRDISDFLDFITSIPERYLDFDLILDLSLKKLEKCENNSLLKFIATIYHKKGDAKNSTLYRLRMGDYSGLSPTDMLYATLENNPESLFEADMKHLQTMSDTELMKVASEVRGELSEDAKSFSNIVKIRAATRGKGVQLFVDNFNNIKIYSVLDKISHNRLNVHIYLDALFARNPHYTKKYRTLQLQACVEYDPERLLDIVDQDQDSCVEKAYEYCEETNNINGKIYLQRLMGNNDKALEIILKEAKDMRMAINLARYVEKENIWNSLFNISIKDKDLITKLLYNCSSEISAGDILDKIPPDLEIEGLRDALIACAERQEVLIRFSDQNDRISSLELTKFLDKLISTSNRGLVLSSLVTCNICSRVIEIKGSQTSACLSSHFLCGHNFHYVCLENVYVKGHIHEVSSNSQDFNKFLDSVCYESSGQDYATNGKEIPIKNTENEILAESSDLFNQECPLCNHPQLENDK